jgi:hypothetical protein
MISSDCYTCPGFIASVSVNIILYHPESGTIFAARLHDPVSHKKAKLSIVSPAAHDEHLRLLREIPRIVDYVPEFFLTKKTQFQHNFRTFNYLWPCTV